MHRLAPEIQTCLEGLFRLLLLAVQAVVLTIFNEMRAYFDEEKGYMSCIFSLSRFLSHNGRQ
jgi:hypothetical protein